MKIAWPAMRQTAQAAQTRLFVLYVNLVIPSLMAVVSRILQTSQIVRVTLIAHPVSFATMFLPIWSTAIRVAVWLNLCSIVRLTTVLSAAAQQCARVARQAMKFPMGLVLPQFQNAKYQIVLFVMAATVRFALNAIRLLF